MVPLGLPTSGSRVCFSWAARFASRGHPSLFLMGLVKASVLGADLGKGPGGRLRTRGGNAGARQSQTLYFLSQRSHPFLTPAALPAHRGAWRRRCPSFWRTCGASGPLPPGRPPHPPLLLLCGLVTAPLSSSRLPDCCFHLLPAVVSSVLVVFVVFHLSIYFSW